MMVRQYMKYGGAAAKVRAMYGRRLRAEDYAALLSLKSVDEVAAYLREKPGFAEALGDASTSIERRVEIEQALKNALNDEFIRVYRFMSREDHPLLGGMIDKAECDEILYFLRAWQSADDRVEYACRMPEYFRKHSQVDYEKLEKLSDFEQFWEAIERSKYFPALAKLPRERGEPPEYTVAKSVMDAKYYSDVFLTIKKHYSGDLAIKLKEGFGAEVDLLNITAILRIKRFFPAMTDELSMYLLPLRGRLRPSLLYEMINAPDHEAAVEVVKRSPYRTLFAFEGCQSIDDYVTMYLWRFNRRMLASPEPSVYTPLAYLNLREIEIQNLVKIIECVRYGMKPQDAGIILPGAEPE